MTEIDQQVQRIIRHQLREWSARLRTTATSTPQVLIANVAREIDVFVEELEQIMRGGTR